MEIYIEYALIENFLYDGLLLWLAYRAAKVETKAWKVCVSAGVGAVFAVIYPLLSLPLWLGTVCKVAVGCLLCLLPFPKLRARGQMKRYALTAVLFFAFSFGFGGALLGMYGPLSLGEKIPSWLVLIGFACLSLLGIYLVKKLYRKRRVYGLCYPCRLWIENGAAEALGFYDSGNLATHQGVPVCFVCPAVLYDLVGDKIWKDGGQVCDEMTISTLGGEKKVRLYSGKIEVKTGQKSVYKKTYFAANKNMIGREYAVLIHARILEGQAEDDAID